MRTTTGIAVAVALALAACGGDDDGGGGAAATPLSQELAGTWQGSGTLTVEGFPGVTFDGQVDLAVSGQTATVTGICPGGSGSLDLHGSGTSASWTGSYACPAVPISQCAEVSITLTSLGVSLQGGTLTAHGAGTGSGCGLSRSFVLDLAGTKTQ